MIIHHQTNTKTQIEKIQSNEGLQIDLRTDNSDIICATAPYENGELFQDIAPFLSNRFVVFKIKSDGIENEVQTICKKHNISDYFFLNSSCDERVKMMEENNSNFAVRCSEYEPIRGSIAFAGKANWVWLDTYSHTPLTKENYEVFSKYFKICVAAPDIYNHPESKTDALKHQLESFKVDAICTRRPKVWKGFFS